MEKIIKRIQEARRDLSNSEGRYPRDEEIAEFTDLSLDKVRLASKCSRTIGSIEQEIGDGWCTKIMVCSLSLHPPFLRVPIWVCV